MPMTYEQLVEWCVYFWRRNPETGHWGCGCGFWEGGRRLQKDEQDCPVLVAGNPRYVPEPIRGNPLGKDILFLAANPGGDGTTQVERDTCPWWDCEDDVPGGTAQFGPGVDWGRVLDGQTSFTNYHVTSNSLAAVVPQLARGYYDDDVTRVAAGTLAWLDGALDRPERVDVGSPAWQGYVCRVAVLNVAHCKSPSFKFNAHEKELIHNAGCGHQSWQLLATARPRCVLCFGWDVWEWLKRITPRDSPLAGRLRSVRSFGETTLVDWGKERTTLLWVPHAGRNKHEWACNVILQHLPPLLMR